MSEFGGRITRNIAQDHSDESLCRPDVHGYCPCPLERAPEETAELVCSDTGNKALTDWDHDADEPVYGDEEHLPVFDLDFPCRLVESGTPGHFHLYVDKPVEWKKYLKVLKVMAEAGLIQYGYLSTTEERGFGAVRHPDRPKQVGK